MADRRSIAEVVCLVLLLGYLIWVPLPFGSATDRAQAPLILPPLVIAAFATLLAGRDLSVLGTSRPARLWIIGAALTLAVVALQLLPLPWAVLSAVSPESARVWRAAARVASQAGIRTTSLHPITVDPADTALQFFRMAAYSATFVASLLLIRSTRRRAALAVILAVMAMFEAVYAIREAALRRYAIWGWKNSLIFNRATGTFVNPNHFAHYAAIIFPMAMFLCALAWRGAAPPGAPARRRLVLLVERRFALFGFGLTAGVACLVAILVAQSRGAVLSLIGGASVAGAIASGRRHGVRRGVLIAVALLAALGGVMFLLGRTETAARFGESYVESGGRRSAVIAAFELWTHFPLFGSGAGTFEDAVATVQEGDERIANHAHNDYAEMLATTGAIGFSVALIPLLAGVAALARTAYGARADVSWRRRAFQTAALTSLAVALIHALVDFNFYIPANPATLAAIAGAAASIRETEK